MGFELEQKEKLIKILNFSGATRYDEISERVTHIVVGNTSSTEVKSIQMKENYQAVMVTVDWLIESMEKQQPVSEANFIVNKANPGVTVTCDSPLSKKVYYLTFTMIL